MSKNLNIIHVDISSNELTSEGLKNFIEKNLGSPSIISLDISSYNGLNRNRLGPVAAETISDFIMSSLVLTFLEMNETGINDPGLEFIIIGLKNNKVLLRLGLASNNITFKHMEEFCRTVNYSNLQELNLANNKIGDEGSKSIANLLVGNDLVCSLKKIDISRNEITFKGSSSIFLAMRYNSVLTHLNMEGNPLGSSAGQSLHFFLFNNFTLTWLNLNSCDLKNGGISHLSLGLAKNKALATLLLSNNSCKDLGMTSLKEALIENKILANLDLSYNLLQDGTIIASALKENIGLESLNLKENKIKEQSGPLLVEATRAKSNLIKLNLGQNHINKKHSEEIKQNLRKNEVIHYKAKAPNIKKEIEKLQNGSKDLQSIYESINKKKHEKVIILTKTQKLKQKIVEIKETKDEKLEELQKEYSTFRQNSLELSTELENILKEIPKFKIFEFRSVKEKEDEIGLIVAEIKALEKKSKTYSEFQRREELNLKRFTLLHMIRKLKEEFNDAVVERASTEIDLEDLNKKMLSMKQELDAIKYDESFFSERKVISPQPFVRVARRQDLMGVRKERSKTNANRKNVYFNIKP